jgi:rhamnose transport system substrate-binding protein
VPDAQVGHGQGITVVTYDSDAPTCRNLFVNQASSQAIGANLVDLMAKEIHNSGDIGIVSAAASATNQNAWIGFMKEELKKYPNVHLVSTVYGNDDPTTATQVTQGLLQRYPNLKGIIAPTSVGIVSAAQVVSSSKYKGKVLVTGLGTPESMKTYVSNGVAPAFYLWSPADLGFLAAYAAVNYASKTITSAEGQSFTAGKLGKFTVGADSTILLGPPLKFDASNIDQYHF